MSDIRSYAYIALGGNLNFRDVLPQATLASAISELAAGPSRLRGVSRFFRTPCFPAGAGPDYVNAVVHIETTLSPEALLQELHRIEASHARQREQRWGMRTLDLDLIDLGSNVLPDQKRYDRWRTLPLDAQMQEVPEQLILPHPRVQDRAFVLVPLCDIAPDWCHPVLNKTAAELLETLPKAEIEAVIPIN